MAIQQLPIELANQIAAGEVVERPASVVKELVENALDAGASELTIEIEQGGTKRIKIRDNGCGIAQQELSLALSRHATSKIRSLDDLESIASLGFRGEALASISSVSRLRLTSKPATQSEAWQAWTEGRDMQVKLEPAAHPDGTTIDIQDLFFNTPARRKFLRTEKTEFSHIDEVVKRIALSRFDVAITLLHNGKRVRQFNRSTDRSDSGRRRRLGKICGSQFAEQALAISGQAGPMQLQGWLASPSECRHQADIQYCFVNGRMMRDKLLNHAIRQAYERYLLPERVPTYVLFFQLPTQQVDVNVHPAKHEVRFHQQRQVHDFILQSVARSLEQHAAPPEPLSQDPDIDSVAATNSAHQYRPQTTVKENYSGYRAGPSILPNARSSASTATPHQPTSAETDWQALAVISGCWLLLRNDQRVGWLNLVSVQRQLMQQQLQSQWQYGLSGQPLLVEVALDLAAEGIQRQRFDALQPTLQQLGINALRQGNRLTVENVPTMLRQGNVAQHMSELLQHLLADRDVQSILAWLADKMVPSDYSLTQAEYWMRQWQRELSADQSHFTELQPPTTE